MDERAAEPYPFRDPDLPLERRVSDLLGRLTLEEKVALLFQYQPAIPRLGIGACKTGTEALHGVAWLGPATVFPQAVGLASTWDPELVERVGEVVGVEARGYHALNPARNGLNLWAPVVNLLRDPRWGRNEEGYSEDPLLTGVIATAYARGLRGGHPVYLRTAPTLKHFLAYNVENDRETVSVSVRPRVLHEYELPAFQPAIAAGAATGIMPSYNFVNGRPAHLSPLINEVVRSWSRQELMVVSDAYAPFNIAGSQRYYPSQAEGHAAAVRAGVDSFTYQGDDPGPTLKALHAALARGLLSEADVDAAAARVLSIRFRLGEFDPPERNPYASITPEVINAPEHRALAREAARRAMVLLRNEGGLLPLDRQAARRVAVVGPLADLLCEDWYSGTLPYKVTPLAGIREALGPGGSVTASDGVDQVALRVAATGRYVTVPPGPAGGQLAATATTAGGAQAFDLFEWAPGVYALRSRANGKHVSAREDGRLANDQEQPNGWVVRETFRFHPVEDGTWLLEHVASGRYVTATGAGGELVAAAASPGAATRFAREVLTDGAAAAAAAARGADVAVVVVGNHPLVGGRETEDREDIALPPAQERLVRAVAAANPRTVLVVETGYPVAITWADEHVPAILWTTHAGQETGRALADVLFGDHNPAGRLTQTWYRSVDDLPGILEYDIIGADRTYLYFKGEPLYPFGHGLTYTTFDYRDLRLSARQVGARGEVAVRVDVTNTGRRAGEEVVQLYTRKRVSRVKQPLRQLRGFQRVRLEPGETAAVQFTLRAADLAVWDVVRGRFVVASGAYDVMVGRSAADVRASAPLTVRGAPAPRRDPVAVTRAADFDDHCGIELVDETRVRGDAVRGRAGAWARFQDVDFSRGVSAFTARVGGYGTGAALQLRLDDPDAGPVLGTVPVPAVEDRYAWAPVTVRVRGAAGVRDLYLVFTGDARLSTFSFTR